MMKIQMLKNQPRPGYFPPLPCYLAGQTYTLATTEEIAMGKKFLADGVAMAVGGLVKGDIPGKDSIPVLAGTGGFIVDKATAEGLGKMAEAGAVSVGDAVKAAEVALDGFIPKTPKRKPAPKKK